MQPFQHEFIQFLLKHQALYFGEFELKSGRISPYFYNSGVFNSGEALALMGNYYATAIQNAQISYDVLFGPAYKGIPLVCTTAIALANKYQLNIPYCFNRKEIKKHGEGGNIVGAPLKGRALIIDDVISAGTAVRESMQIIKTNQSEPAGVVVALDRQEHGQQQISAIQEIEQTYSVPVISIVKLEHIIEYLSQQPSMNSVLEKMQAYQKQYGV